MSESFEGAVSHFGREGARRFAGWDAPLYSALAGSQAKHLWTEGGRAPAVLEAYLTLLVEAIGLGYIGRASLSADSAENLITLFFVRRIPETIKGLSVEETLALFARMWNLGEGLLQEPPWINRYVTSALGDERAFGSIEERLSSLLEPALSVRAPSRFQGPFTVSVLDAADLDEAFVPGEMHLCAPAVLCVHDRRRAGMHAGVFLRDKGASSFLSLTPCLGKTDVEGDDLPTATLFDGGVRIGQQSISLPFLKHGHASVLAPTGFFVASAVDSQRLWVVESP